MWSYIHTFFSGTLKFFFLFTPFFALSMFLCLTGAYTEQQKKRAANRIMISTFLLCVGLLFLGKQIFDLFGITLNAFRVGVGTILLLNGIGLVKGRIAEGESDPNRDITVVPMAIPVIVGPATIGAILVMGSDIKSVPDKLANLLGIAAASFCLWLMLYLATTVEKKLGQRGLEILSKITGLILASLAAQMMLMGLRDSIFTK